MTPHTLPLAALALLATAPACADLDEACADGRCDEAGAILVADPAAAAARATAVAAATADLTPRYGVRPRDHRGAFDLPINETEEEFARMIPEVAAFVNQRLQAAGLRARVTAAELAENFLAEGGILLLHEDKLRADDIAGYYYAGIDTIVDRYPTLKHYLPPDVQRVCEDPTHHERQQNELGQWVTSLEDLTFAQALYANAGMYAKMLELFEKDLQARGIAIATLAPLDRFFWTTMYFNAGEGAARQSIRDRTLAWSRTPWTGDPEAHAGQSLVGDQRRQYNAILRTANLALLTADLGPPVARAAVELPAALAAIDAYAAATRQVYVTGERPFFGAELRHLRAALFALRTAVDVPDAVAAGLEPVTTAAANLHAELHPENVFGFDWVIAGLYRAIGLPVPTRGEIRLEPVVGDLIRALADGRFEGEDQAKAKGVLALAGELGLLARPIGATSLAALLR
jgi:hypothetical protein